MYLHKSGYHPPNEAIATHARRRYRLTPAANPSPNLPPCDSSLWIYHYSEADPINRVPAQGITMTPNLTASWSVRRQLQQHGQLVRKEFMLNDRAHWPTINPPSGNIASYGSQSMGYPGNVISHLNRTQQQQFLQQQHASGGHATAPPVKRQRIAPPSHTRTTTSIAATALAQDALADDDEDTSKGDFMDHLTPRDISTTRFAINHENMEEIFNSPYTIRQIIPGPLGLGRKGEIEELTKGFFDAPTESTPTVPSGADPPRVGRLPPGKADEFRAKAAQKVSALEAEMAEMRRKHNEEMAKIRAGSIIMEEERRLRTAPMSSNSRFDDWIFDGSVRGTTLGDLGITGPRETVGEIASRVEAFLGKKIVVVPDVDCVQKGGLEEKTGDISEGIDYDMISASPSNLEQQEQSISYTQQDSVAADPIPSLGQTPHPAPDGVEDIIMAELPEVPEVPEVLEVIDRKNSDTGSWVMVGEENQPGASPNQQPPVLDNFADLPATTAVTEQPSESLNTPVNILPNLTPEAPETTTEDFNANDFTDAINFGNLDTAGDALASYGEENASLGLDEHGDLGIDDSAFGEAFHATQSSPGPQTNSPAP